jgi:hypothetical protein
VPTEQLCRLSLGVGVEHGKEDRNIIGRDQVDVHDVEVREDLVDYRVSAIHLFEPEVFVGPVVNLRMAQFPTLPSRKDTPELFAID